MNRWKLLSEAAGSFLEKSKEKTLPALFGFDGYIDSLYAVVERTDEHGFQTCFKTSDAFLACLAGLNGQSGERELQLKSRRAGGNAPLTAMAAGALGIRAHCMAYIGNGLEVFDPVRKRCCTTSLGAPAECMALEFSNCKWMFGSCESLRSFDVRMLMQDDVDFFGALQKNRLIALLNWAAMPQNAAVVKAILNWDEASSGLEKKVFFIDFSDISALAEGTVKEYLHLIRLLGGRTHVIISVNLHEAQHLAQFCQADDAGEEELLRAIQTYTGAQEIVLHAMDHALCLEHGAIVRCEGAYLSSPAITTGGGDHFNGGYCAAKLAGLDAQDRLALATGTALYYVAHGLSGTAEAIEEWLKAPQIKELEE